MSITIKIVLTGGQSEETYPVVLDPEMNGKWLLFGEGAAMVEQMTKIPIMHQHISFEGEQLTSDHAELSLASIGIKKASKILVKHRELKHWEVCRNELERALNVKSYSLKVRKEFAESAINTVVTVLKRSNFFDTYPEYKTQFEEHRQELDDLVADNTEFIKEAARSYFSAWYGAAKLAGNLQISFGKKDDGGNVGVICFVRVGDTLIKYHIKTHQGGGNAYREGLENAPRLKELFVYKLLAETRVGPEEVHIILPTATDSTRMVYIATKGITGFTELKVLLNPLPKSMAQLLFLKQLLRLEDLHLANCGQGSDGRPLIVDFEVKPNSPGAKLLSHPTATMLLNRLHDGFIDKWYEAAEVLGNTAPIEALAQCVGDQRVAAVKEGLALWDLPQAIDRALLLFQEEKIRLENWGLVSHEQSGTTGKTVPEYAAAIKLEVELLLDYFGTGSTNARKLLS